jgi:hypothetical protein
VILVYVLVSWISVHDRDSFRLSLFRLLKKLATSSGLSDAELDVGGPNISEESAYRYTSIFQVGCLC